MAPAAPRNNEIVVLELDGEANWPAARPQPSPTWGCEGAAHARGLPACALELCEPFAEADELDRRPSGMYDHPAAHYAPRVARLEVPVSRLLGALRRWPPDTGSTAAGIRCATKLPSAWTKTIRILGLAGRVRPAHRRIRGARIRSRAASAGAAEAFDPAQRARFADWLRAASRARAVDNNWRLFATLVNLGLKSVGEPFDAEITTAAFLRVDEFHHGGGSDADGPGDERFHHYNPWAIHFYGLLNAALGGCDTCTDTVLERARDFAPEYLRWFAVARRPRVRPQPDIPIRAGRVLRRDGIRRRAGSGLGRLARSTGAADPIMVGTPIPQWRRHPLDRLRLSQPADE